MSVPVTIDEHSNYLARLFAMVRLFAAVHESGSGLSRHFAAMRNLDRYRGIADSRDQSVRPIYGFTA